MITTISIFATILISSIVLFILIIRAKKTKIVEKATTINTLYKVIEKLSNEKKLFEDRTNELENSIEREFGFKPRIIQVDMKTEFTKLEMIIILAGVSKLLQKSNLSVDDAKIYIELCGKIQGYIDNMKEEE